jgi:hypothetical protein
MSDPVLEEVADRHVPASERPTLRMPHARDWSADLKLEEVKTSPYLQIPTRPSMPRSRADGPSGPSLPTLTLASFARVPLVMMTSQEVREAKLDVASAFVLGLLDGEITVESVLDVCPLPTHHVLRILTELIEAKVVALR